MRQIHLKIKPDGIEVNIAGGKMYWTDMGPGGVADKSVAINDDRIMHADLDDKNVETLISTDLISPDRNYD